MKRWLVLAFVISITGLYAQNGKTALPCNECKNDEQIMARVMYAAQVQSGWGANNPPVALSVVEVKREKPANGDTLITYHLVAKGYPPNVRFELHYWPIGGEITLITKGIAIDADGTLLCDSPAGCGKHPTHPMEIAMKSARGEPQRFALMAEKGNWIATGLTISFPAEGEDQGCKISMALLEKDGRAIYVRGTGFPPNADIQISGNSAGEMKASTRHTNGEGEFGTVELPYVIGKDAGTDKTTVVGGAACRPSASLDWGAGTYQRQ